MNYFNKKYFNLIKEFSLAWFMAKDQRSILGFLWSFLNPLIMTAILFFLFKSRVKIGDQSDYFLYILVGTVIWNFFATSTSRGLTSISEMSDLVKNAAFPNDVLVLSAIGEFLIQHVFELLAVFVFIFILGGGFSMHILLFPLIICVEIMFIAGISLFLSCICVYVNDLKHIWSVILRMAFFVVPIFYNTDEISAQFRPIILINPMSQIIIFSRDILLYQRLPSMINLICVSTFSFLVLIGGYAFFKHREYKIAERV